MVTPVRISTPHSGVKCRSGPAMSGKRFVGSGFSRDALRHFAAKASDLNVSPTVAERAVAASGAVLAFLLRCRKRLQPRCSSPTSRKNIEPKGFSHRSRASGAGFLGGPCVSGLLLEVASATCPLFGRMPLADRKEEGSNLKGSPTVICGSAAVPQLCAVPFIPCCLASRLRLTAALSAIDAIIGPYRRLAGLSTEREPGATHRYP